MAVVRYRDDVQWEGRTPITESNSPRKKRLATELRAVARTTTGLRSIERRMLVAPATAAANAAPAPTRRALARRGGSKKRCEGMSRVNARKKKNSIAPR
jgi:hypothetical protein